MTQIAPLPARGVVELTGADRIAFLQGLVSNDVTQVEPSGAEPGRAVWAALLTPQGRWLADFLILAEGERLLLDCARTAAPEIVARLSRFKLRAEVALRDASEELVVHAAWDGPAPEGGIVAADPRLPQAGWRVLAPAPLEGSADAAAWDMHRLALGLPEPEDMEAERTLLLEAGFDALGGISWTKGCYMGQEVTARTRFRGLVKRRLVPVEIAGALPAPGSPVVAGETEIGQMRSGRATTPRGGRGLAMLKTEALAATQPLRCGTATLTPNLPEWLRGTGTAAQPRL